MFFAGFIKNLYVVSYDLLLGAVFIGVGFYFWFRTMKPNKIKKHTLKIKQDDFKFEAAKEISPIFFPSEPEPEKIHELPLAYSDDKIAALPRDPETIFTYWDISEEKHASLEYIYGSKWKEGQPILRVYNMSENNGTPSEFDVYVEEHAKSWYVDVGNPGGSFYVELGRMLNDGQFVVIARSNLIQTPRNSISDKIDSDWMPVSENERKLFGRVHLSDNVSSVDRFEYLL